MLFKILSNINYIFYFICIAFVLLILTYIIYKMFILEADIYILLEKVNKIELEFNTNTNSSSTSCSSHNKDNGSMKLSDIIMNEVFKPYSSVFKTNDTNTDISNDTKDVIDIDDIIDDIKDKEPDNKVIFDLKKDVTVVNDNESVISSSNQITKKKLQKLHLDKLKEKCVELEISTEGHKSQIIERILEELNKEV
jgi:hypothetical protein